MAILGSRSNGRRNRGRNGAQVDIYRNDLVGGLLVRAISRDMAEFAALVAALASGAKRASSRSRTVLGDVPNLPAGVALDGLSLAIPSKVIRPTALVAGGGATTGETAARETTTKSATADGSPTAKSLSRWVGARALHTS